MAEFDFDAYVAGGSSAGFDFDAYVASNPTFASETNAVMSRVNSDIADKLGGPVDLVNKGLSYIGLDSERPFGGSESIRAGMRAVGINPDLQPQTGMGRTVAGAAEGAMDVASVLVPAMAASRMTNAGSIAGGAARSMTAQPAMQAAAGATGGAVEGATDNPWLGLAATLATPVAAGMGARAISPVRNQLSPNEQRAAQLAAKMGIKLTPGQATGSRPLQAAESSLTQLPFSSGPQQALYDAQRAGLNRSIFSKAGINADSYTPELLDDAYRTLGKQFDDLAAKTEVTIDKTFFDSIDDVVQNYGRRLPTDVKPVFQSYVDDIAKMKAYLPDGSGRMLATPEQLKGADRVLIEGDVYKNIASNLRAAARKAKNNPDLQEALGGLSEALDDAMGRSAPPEVQSGWKEARRLYRNLLTIDDAIASGAKEGRSAGDIPIAGLKNAAKRMDPRGFARGRGPFADDVAVGEFLAPRIPNSGTPERSRMMGLMTGAGPGSVAGGAMIAGADPITATGMAAGTLALPPLVQKLINSGAGRAYLTNQLAANQGVQPGPLASMLLGRLPRE